MAILTAIAELAGEVRALRLAVLPGRGGRDEADRRLLLTISESSQALPFRASDLLRRAEFDRRLAEALLAADIVSSKEIGKWLARMVEHPTDGVQVEHGRSVRGAIRWRVSQVCES